MAKLAIDGGKPVRKKDFPSWPIFREEERLCQEAIWIGHTVLLAEKEDMEDIVRAIIKIRENLKEIR